MPKGGTTKLPKQIDPKEFVTASTKCSLKTLVQHELSESALVHHDPTIPATVTCTTFY